MNFSQIISILILLIFNNSSIDCFFIPNPLNWFRRPTTELPENQTVSTVSSLEPTIDNISDQMPTQSVEQLFELPINQMKPIQPIVPSPTTRPFSAPDRPFDPLTLSQLGLPVKVNRFGLEPLPYPLKTSHSKLPRINLENDSSLSSQVLHRRVGHILQTSTQMPFIGDTDDDIQKELNATEENYLTQISTESSTPETDMTSKEVVEDDNEYLITDSDLVAETDESDDVSPMPVYRQTTYATPDRDQTTVSYTTPKPTYLHNEEFANLLNNMYYQKPEEMFEPMMNQFNGRALK